MSAVASYLLQTALPALLGASLWRLTLPLRRHIRARRRLICGKYREPVILILFMFLSGLFALTLTPSGFWDAVLHGRTPRFSGPFQGEINLIPFSRSLEILHHYHKHGLWDAILINFPGNIVMFLPIGFLFGLLDQRPRWRKSLLYTGGISLFIELFQLLVSRGTDIDDLILNTIGGLAGYWVFLIVRGLAPQFVQACAKTLKGSA